MIKKCGFINNIKVKVSVMSKVYLINYKCNKINLYNNQLIDKT